MEPLDFSPETPARTARNACRPSGVNSAVLVEKTAAGKRKYSDVLRMESDSAGGHSGTTSRETYWVGSLMPDSVKASILSLHFPHVPQ